jgi:hypothetical protein
MCASAKQLSDVLDEKFSVSNGGSEFYTMEQLFDYKIVDNSPAIEQANEIQTLAKKLKQFPCVWPDKFLVGGIITKLMPSWRDFATTLKHIRQEFSLAELIEILDVKERAREKDNSGKGDDTSSANMVQNKNSLPVPQLGASPASPLGAPATGGDPDGDDDDSSSSHSTDLSEEKELKVWVAQPITRDDALDTLLRRAFDRHTWSIEYRYVVYQHSRGIYSDCWEATCLVRHPEDDLRGVEVCSKHYFIS